VDERPSNVVEELVRDGVADQRKAGLIPRPNDVHKYVQNIVETMEKRDADNRLRIKPKAPPPPPEKTRSTEEMESEYQKRCRRAGIEPTQGSWTVTRASVKPEKTKLQLDSERTRLAKQRMRARLRLLRSKPDWAVRLKRINPLALQGQLGPEKKKHAEFLVCEVIKASEVPFGPWWKAPPKKLWFSGK
jgi:hypothetical protein